LTTAVKIGESSVELTQLRDLHLHKFRITTVMIEDGYLSVKYAHSKLEMQILMKYFSLIT